MGVATHFAIFAADPADKNGCAVTFDGSLETRIRKTTGESNMESGTDDGRLGQQASRLGPHPARPGGGFGGEHSAPNTAPIYISSRDTMHPRAGAMLDACDTGQGMYASPTDPQTFFLHEDDEDDDAPVMTIEAGRNLILENDENDQERERSQSLSRGFSRGSHGSMGSFPPIPEDYVPLNGDEDYTSERFAMVEAEMLARGAAGVPQLDDFSVRYGGPGQGIGQGVGGLGRGMVPRVASMPNFSVGMGRVTSSESLEEMVASPSERGPTAFTSSRGEAEVGRSRRVPKSFSTNDLSSLVMKYDVPHAQFLTAPSLRKGKGGRQPKMDPRMDPNIDPKKAKRILANRLSAAKSKLKQKTVMDGLKVKIQGLEQNKVDLEREIAHLESAYHAELATNSSLWGMRRERNMVE